MIEISRENGTVTWDGFKLHSQLTHDEFISLYPELSIINSFYSFFGLDRTYNLPEIQIEDYRVLPQVICRNDRVCGVSFEMNACYNESDPECGMSQLLKRSEFMRRLLINNLGQPKHYNPHCFGFFEGTLTPTQIDALQAWEYAFDWGRAQTCCFFDQGDIVLMGPSVGYDLHHQINSWDKLIEDCDRHIQYEREYDGTHTKHLLEIRSLIDVLKPHFEFQTAKPYINIKGLTFLIEGVARITIDVNPDDDTKKYKIWRRAKKPHLLPLTTILD